MYVSVSLSVCPLAHMSVCLFVCLTISNHTNFLSVYLSVCLSVCLSAFVYSVCVMCVCVPVFLCSCVGVYHGIALRPICQICVYTTEVFGCVPVAFCMNMYRPLCSLNPRSTCSAVDRTKPCKLCKECTLFYSHWWSSHLPSSLIILVVHVLLLCMAVT